MLFYGTVWEGICSPPENYTLAIDYTLMRANWNLLSLPSSPMKHVTMMLMIAFCVVPKPVVCCYILEGDLVTVPHIVCLPLHTKLLYTLETWHLHTIPTTYPTLCVSAYKGHPLHCITSDTWHPPVCLFLCILNYPVYTLSVSLSGWLSVLHWAPRHLQPRHPYLCLSAYQVMSVYRSCNCVTHCNHHHHLYLSKLPRNKHTH